MTITTQLDDLDFADDLVLLSHNHRQMQEKTSQHETNSARTGLNINKKKKSKVKKINATVNARITVNESL